MKKETRDIVTFIVKLVAITALALLLSFFLEAKEYGGTYCDGFYKGWDAGACYQIPNCIPPVAPLCPLPTVNEQNTYEDGYTRGFATAIENRN
jgi:hypothetical protein